MSGEPRRPKRIEKKKIGRFVLGRRIEYSQWRKENLLRRSPTNATSYIWDSLRSLPAAPSNYRYVVGIEVGPYPDCNFAALPSAIEFIIGSLLAYLANKTPSFVRARETETR